MAMRRLAVANGPITFFKCFLFVVQDVLEVLAVRHLTEVIKSLNDADWSRRVLETVAVRLVLLVEILSPPTHIHTQ